MSDTQALMNRITALRQRLESSVSSALPRVNQLEVDSEHDLAVDRLVRPLQRSDSDWLLPSKLSFRARQVLERGRELLDQLRLLADAFEPLTADSAEADDTGRLLDKTAPLSVTYRQTVAMMDTALRMLPSLPDTISGQMQVAEGLETILKVVSDRLAMLQTLISEHRQEQEQIDRLALLLRAVASNKPVEREAFYEIANDLYTEAHEGEPLSWPQAHLPHVDRYVAAHSLSVARVMARVIRHDVDLRSRTLDGIVAALLHDVGMVRVPVDILGQKGPLDEEQRRTIEAHTLVGADLVGSLAYGAAWLTEAVERHHERLDGSGYPGGRSEYQLSGLTRLLGVCDVYAALASPRAHRPARDPRTALTDTLLLAEKGFLDSNHAEKLLVLSFYPTGSAVEMADGSVGIVVATPGHHRDLTSPSRPVVALLIDSEGKVHRRPRHVDLAQAEGLSIVRTLGHAERRARLGLAFPEWAA